MGFFDGLVDAVSKPIRGIGRIVRGKFEEGLNDIGSGVKSAAPYLAWVPGVGPVAAGIAGAAGSFVDEITDRKRGVDWMNPVKSGVSGWGSGKLASAVGGVEGVADAAKGGLKGIGKLVGMGGGEAATDVATKTPMLSSLGSKGAEAAATAGGEAAKSGGLDALSKAALITQGVGAGAQAYGAHQLGKAEDRRIAFEEGQVERRNERNDALDPMRAELLKMILSRLNSGMAPAAAA